MTSNTERDYLAFLNRHVVENSLEAFYPRDCEALRGLASRASTLIQAIHPRFIRSAEIAQQMSLLPLYRVVLLLDDSGSMKQDEQGRRIPALEVFLNRITEIATPLDREGITIRWLNHSSQPSNIMNTSQISQLVRSNPFRGWTKLGTELQNKILEPMVLQLARQRRLAKPVLVMIITDGEPNQEPATKLKDSILHAQRELRNSNYGNSAVAFQIARVGNSAEAQRFLHSLDIDRDIGNIFDFTSEYGIDTAARLVNERGESTFDDWVAKLMLGGIHRGYDEIND